MPSSTPKGMSRLKQGGVAVVALAIAVVGGFEGLRTKAYVSGIKGDPPTVCYGETRGVRLGDQYTVAECKQMLADGLDEFSKGIDKCLKDPTRIPDKSYVAFLSVAWNIGQSAFCGSSMAKSINAGNIAAACDALLKWNKAGGKPILTKRRQEERKLCLEGVKEGVVTLAPAKVPVPVARPEVVVNEPPAPTPVAPPAPKPAPVQPHVVVIQTPEPQGTALPIFLVIGGILVVAGVAGWAVNRKYLAGK